MAETLAQRVVNTFGLTDKQRTSALERGRDVIVTAGRVAARLVLSSRVMHPCLLMGSPHVRWWLSPSLKKQRVKCAPVCVVR